MRSSALPRPRAIDSTREHWLCAISLAIVACLLSGCRNDASSDSDSTDGAGELVVYCSADQHVAQPLIATFEAAYPNISVKTRFDTETTKTTALVARLRAEKDRPRADVFWSSEVFMTIQLANEGLLAPYDDPSVADWPATFRDPQGRWYGFAGRARVIAYAPDRVTDVPATWQDLTRATYRNRVIIADPNFGTTRGHIATWFTTWGDEDATSYIRALLANGTRVVASNSQAVRDVVAGTADFALTDTDDVWASQRNGHSLDLVYPRHGEGDGMGTLLIPNTIGLVAGRPDNEAARTFVRFMLSAEAQMIMHETDSHNIPIGHDSDHPLRPKYVVPDPLAVDYATIAAKMPEAIRITNALIGGDEP